MAAQIILLHGASSSGKSTIARALQARLVAPFWHISIDHLRDSGVLPMGRFRSAEFDWIRHRAAIFDGFHASLAAYAQAGNNLIVEHILDNPVWVGDLKRLLAPFDVFFVGIHCSLATLVAREAARQNRPLGSAAQDFATLHQGRRYDLDLESENDLNTTIDQLIAAWKSGRRVSEFSQN